MRGIGWGWVAWCGVGLRGWRRPSARREYGSQRALHWHPATAGGQIEELREHDPTLPYHRAGARAGAVRLGISRALMLVNAEFRDALKVHGYLTRDAREVERLLADPERSLLLPVALAEELPDLFEGFTENTV